MRGRVMGERGEEGVARPGEKGNGERGGRKGLSALHSQSLYRISSAHNIKHDTFEWVFPRIKINKPLEKTEHSQVRVCTSSVCIM